MPSSQRFLALDIFRGMTVCFMIIVNTPGNEATTYPPLLHAHWNGFTPTDLVFPSFLFAVGNAMSFSLRKWEGHSESFVLWKIFKRALIIFLLGYLMYWFPFVHWTNHYQLAGNPMANTRIMGVLQRIALGYFFGALLIRYFKLRTVLIISICLLFVYWILLLAFAGGNDPYDMLTNAGTRLDLWLFGSKHLYHGEGVAFDPEGILSTIPAIANVVFGFAAGKWIQEKARPDDPRLNDTVGQAFGRGKTYEGIAKLLLWGSISIFLALMWDWFFPINKKLWTGSYVFLTVGIDCMFIAFLIYITDFLGKTKWGYFFEVFGKNPLLIYLLSELGATMLWFIPIGTTHQPLYLWLFQNIFKNAGMYFGSFLFALSFMLFCWFIGWILDKSRIYVRV